jgi:hypothetical protein
LDQYRIGVSIVLANGVSPVLAIIGRDLLGIRASVNDLTKGFAAWNSRLVGVASLLGGAAMLGAMTKLAEKAADFQDAMTKVSQLNPKVAALVNSGQMNNLAFGVGRSLGMNVEDVTKVYGGIYGVLQDPKEAEELTPIAARYARLMQMRHPGSHPEGSINTLMRAGELSGRLTNDSGAIDPKKVEEWFDLAARLEAATHGQVNADTLLGLAQQGGGIALRGLSQEGYEHMAIVAQMMGGQRAGTSLLSLRSQLSGTMMKRSAQAMQDYGLLKDDEWSSEGGHVQITGEAQKRLTSLVSSDPMKFVNELVDRLEAKGITDKDDQMIALQRILGRQTTQRMVADMLLARQQIQRETEGLEQGVSVRQGLEGYGRNIHANMQNLSSAWSNMMVAISGPNSENFVKVLQSLTAVLDSAGAFAATHPETIAVVMEAIGALGIALVGAGAAAVVALGGIPAVITGIVVAAGALIAANWNAISAGFAAAGSALYEIGQYKWQQIVGVLQGISSAISSFIDAIMAIYSRVKGLVIPSHPADPKFNEELRKGNESYVPMRFDSGRDSGRGGPVTLALNVDGRTMAQAMIDNIDGMTTFPSQAPTPDGTGRYFAGDHNSWDT